MPADQPRQALVEALRHTEAHHSNLADHFDPPSPDIVEAPYIVAKVGWTTEPAALLV